MTNTKSIKTVGFDVHLINDTPILKVQLENINTIAVFIHYEGCFLPKNTSQTCALRF